MDKYTKAVLTVIALCVLALPVKAEEKVWYCEMRGFVEVTSKGVQKLELQKFKISVNSDEIVFGRGGYFDNARAPMWKFISADFWWARGYLDFTTFKDGFFSFSSSGTNSATAISAICDDF